MALGSGFDIMVSVVGEITLRVRGQWEVKVVVRAAGAALRRGKWICSLVWLVRGEMASAGSEHRRKNFAAKLPDLREALHFIAFSCDFLTFVVFHAQAHESEVAGDSCPGELRIPRLLGRACPESIGLRNPRTVIFHLPSRFDLFFFLLTFSQNFH